MNSVTDDLSRTHCEAETRYRQAHVCLEQAQSRRTEAVCQFLEAQALWKTTADCREDGDAEGGVLMSAAALSGETPDLLSQAAADMNQAKMVYCAVVEQSHLVQRLLDYARNNYCTAQEKMERLAREEQAG